MANNDKLLEIGLIADMLLTAWGERNSPNSQYSALSIRQGLRRIRDLSDELTRPTPMHIQRQSSASTSVTDLVLMRAVEWHDSLRAHSRQTRVTSKLVGELENLDDTIEEGRAQGSLVREKTDEAIKDLAWHREDFEVTQFLLAIAVGTYREQIGPGTFQAAQDSDTSDSEKSKE